MCREKSQLVLQVGASVPGALLKCPQGFAKAVSHPWLQCQKGAVGQRKMGTRRTMWDARHKGRERRNVLLEVQEERDGHWGDGGGILW